MPDTPSPYDIISAVDFVQGCLTLIAAVVGAFWSATQQARLNKVLAIRLDDKMKQLRQRHDGKTKIGSGITKERLTQLTGLQVTLRRLELFPAEQLQGSENPKDYKPSSESSTSEQRKASAHISLEMLENENAKSSVTPIVPRKTWWKQWLEQGQDAEELVKISNQLDAIELEFHIILVRDQILEEMDKRLSISLVDSAEDHLEPNDFRRPRS